MPNTPGTVIRNSLIPQTISHHTNARTTSCRTAAGQFGNQSSEGLPCTETKELAMHTHVHRYQRQTYTERHAGDESVKNKTKTPESTHNPVKPVFLHESLIISRRKERWRGGGQERER